MAEKHPVQKPKVPNRESRISSLVTLRAYEVYSAIYSPQPAMITGWCRGGFSTGELMAFLYAHSFPKEEWRQRVDEAFDGMENL